MQQPVEEESLSPPSSENLPRLLEPIIDPLYAPLLQAATSLREKIEATHRAKIETIKRETADQTEMIYHKLTAAREEFKNLQEIHSTHLHQIEVLTEEKSKLTDAVNAAHAHLQEQQQQLDLQKSSFRELEEKFESEVGLINIKSDALIEKLKEKINQIHQDYDQQLDHLQQKLSFQKSQLTDEVSLLTKENDKLTQELQTLHQEQQGSGSLQEKLLALESERINLEVSLKEKAEKLLRAEHSLKLSHEEVERNQQYIKALEDKNNTIQKELFENWILKKDEL